MRFFTTLTLAVATAAVTLAQSPVYVVPGGSGTQSGTSWSNASGDLAAAMAGAAANTEIWVAQGTYLPTACAGACTAAERFESFLLKPGVAVIGGFVGIETDASQASPTNVTVLSGDIGSPGDSTDNSYNVVFCERCGDAAELRNLTISGGNADVATGSGVRGDAGGGLYIDALNGVASPTLTDCVIRDNVARTGGAGVYARVFSNSSSDLSPTFQRTIVTANTSFGDGGGLSISVGDASADIRFFDCEISANRTVNAGSPGLSGGGVFANVAGGRLDMTFDRCLISANVTDASSAPGPSGFDSANGGGIYFRSNGVSTGSTLTLRNSVVSLNSSYAGAGIYLLNSTGSLSNVTMTSNVARGSGGSGGGYYLNKSVATVTNSVIFGNTVPNNTSNTKDIRWVTGANDKASLTASYTLFSSTSRQDLFGPAPDDAIYNEGAGIIYGTNPGFDDLAAAVPQPTAASPGTDAGLTSAAVIAGGDFFGRARVEGIVDLGAVELQSQSLPVELISLSGVAHAHGTEVTWQVGTELALAGYRLERGSGGADFAEIGYLPARGASDYAFTDAHAASGVSYYRLVSVDLDGSSATSDVIAVERSGLRAQRLLAYPNPASAYVQVRVVGVSAADEIALALVDGTGRVVRRWRERAAEVVDLDLVDVPAGVYVLRAQWGSGGQATVLAVR